MYNYRISVRPPTVGQGQLDNKEKNKENVEASLDNIIFYSSILRNQLPYVVGILMVSRYNEDILKNWAKELYKEMVSVYTDTKNISADTPIKDLTLVIDKFKKLVDKYAQWKEQFKSYLTKNNLLPDNYGSSLADATLYASRPSPTIIPAAIDVITVTLSSIIFSLSRMLKNLPQ